LTSASIKPLKTTLDRLYGPTADNRLTLVTASSGAPWDTSSATEVVARLEGEPFAPTPQQARSASQTGTRGETGTLPAVVLALLAFGIVVAGSVVLYGRLRFRTAYILSIAPLVAITVVAGETLARLLPAWT
jgi:sortase A